MNQNCLVGFECPECGSQGPFKIQAETLVTMHDDGAEEAESFEWGVGSFCQCSSCGHQAVVGAFTGESASSGHAGLVERVARAICLACDENPDHSGDARGNAKRWQDYERPALAALEAAL